MKKLMLAALLLVVPACSIAPETVDVSRHVVVLENIEGVPFCSGVAVAADRVLTAKHCMVLGKERMQVRTRDGNSYGVVLVRESATADAAILVITEPVLRPAPLGDAAQTRVGDEVVAVGHPFGHRWTVTYGRVSKVDAQILGDGNILQFLLSAMAAPGSSGGGLFNARGELIGLTNGGYTGYVYCYALRLDSFDLAAIL